MNKVLLAAALAAGGLIAYVDSRPGWDDTGVSAAAIFGLCGLFGAAGPGRPWLWAVAVGAWVPAFGLALSANYGALLALPVAFAGAYAGAAVRRLAAMGAAESSPGGAE
jgi:hypothetical protein